MLLNLRLTIRKFWQKHKYKVIIALLIWLVLIIVNYMLKHNKTPVTPSVSYTPHESIMDTKEKVPQNLTSSIEDWMDSFYTACNNKEYEEAYSKLSEEYRSNNTLENFKKHVDDIFSTNNTYVIQNYSNQENIYIYKVKIMEDILSTGLTGKDELEYVEEIVTIKKNGKDLEFSIGNKIYEEELNKVYENEHMKVTVTKKQVQYDSEIYTVEIANRTDYTIVLNNFANTEEVLLNLGDVQRGLTGTDIEIVIEPESKLRLNLKFTKFFDDGRTAKSLQFKNARIFEEYYGDESDDEALRKYSFEIKL